MQSPKIIQAPTGKILSDGEPQLAEGHYDLGLAIRDNPIAGGRFTGNVPTAYYLPAARGQSGMDGIFQQTGLKTMTAIFQSFKLLLNE